LIVLTTPPHYNVSSSVVVASGSNPSNDPSSDKVPIRK